MKPFEELTYLGRLKRMRQLAHVALQAYDLCEPRLTFLRQLGNTLYQVNEANPTHSHKPDTYAPGQYLLRIHHPTYQTPAAIELELDWLATMCHQADLPVPEPLPTLDGKLCTQVATPGIPGKRVCSLLRWVKGKELRRDEIQPRHYTALGELMARLHHHAALYQPPAGLEKRTYDWDGLFQQQGSDGRLSMHAWSLLPPEYIEPFKIVSHRVIK